MRPVGDGTLSLMPAGSTSPTCVTGSHNSGTISGITPVNERGRDADDGVRRPRSCSVVPTTAGSPPKSARHMRCEMTTTRSASGRIVGGLQHAAEKGADAEHVEVVRRDELAHHQPRAIAEIERRKHRRVAGHVAEDGVLRLEVEKVGIGGGRVLVAVAAAGEHIDERVRVLDRQRPQQHARRRARTSRC